MGFCKTENSLLERKSLYVCICLFVCLFVCLFIRTNCVLTGDPVLEKSEHVAPFDTYTLCCVD